MINAIEGSFIPKENIAILIYNTDYEKGPKWINKKG